MSPIKRPKRTCPYCDKQIRQIGKHINQKHGGGVRETV